MALVWWISAVRDAMASVGRYGMCEAVVLFNVFVAISVKTGGVADARRRAARASGSLHAAEKIGNLAECGGLPERDGAYRRCAHVFGERARNLRTAHGERPMRAAFNGRPYCN
ncbi:hypothetical protein [Burkholderia pseudomallei]|uniref:hypothetical protein n=1 Tax=Burkholderia pseudomallei TaxID=28450 RepID=UPI001009A393|nr:hypothetical protein [Burkholderia pseudomallei]MBF3697595.1 hypothetical protein [Burkholderia pseudomallei]MBO3045845.1 hypothetical protein [Burkholderia pseudomallei]MDI6018565.1 hypothetical protein [Burkholderia pseudomallei]QCU50239.1 hypothetical protein FFM54_11645 [Burkholderia pseudomallei]